MLWIVYISTIGTNREDKECQMGTEVAVVTCSVGSSSFLTNMNAFLLVDTSL